MTEKKEEMNVKTRRCLTNQYRNLLEYNGYSYVAYLLNFAWMQNFKQGVFCLLPGFGGHLLPAFCQIIGLQGPLHAQTLN